MVVGICIFELHLPTSRGLKEKRRVIKPLIERIHQRYRISIAETDHHDLLQRAEISLAVVAQNHSEAERMLDEVRNLIDEEGEAYLTIWNPQVLEGLS